MNIALQKTLELLIIIGIGVLLQKKISKSDLKGTKVIILSIALPAVIFLAILKIKLESSLIIFPILALVFNLIMYAVSKYIIAPTLSKDEDAKKRTIVMLFPSLAPGLSAFPFIMIYLGDDSIALAALADVGNKIFVLIILYLIAMKWYRDSIKQTEKVSINKKLKGLIISLINEPINLVLIVALVLLGLGFNISSLPTVIGSTITTLSTLMTPLVLLFIGMAVRITAREFSLIFSLLMKRAGITFLISAIFIFLIPSLEVNMILLLIVFAQSSCSFWPFAHMSSIAVLEEKDNQTSRTFDVDFAVNLLACSLPFSAILIISVFSFSEFFINPNFVLICGIIMTILSFTPSLKTVYKKAKSKKSELKEVRN